MTGDSGQHGVLHLLKNYKKSFITLSLFVGYSATVFLSSTDSLQRLQESAHIQFALEAEKRASAISYFFSERRNDIAELAESETITSFFKNRDLGMTFQYGLGVNVQLIEDRFERIIERKRVNAQTIYNGLILINRDGSTIAGVPRQTILGSPDQWLDSGNHVPRISISDDRREVLVSAPVWINQTYRGEILARVNAGTSFAQFGLPGSRENTFLTDRTSGKVISLPGSDVARLVERYWKELSEPSKQGKVISHEASAGDDNRIILTKVDIEHAPLSFVLLMESQDPETGLARTFLKIAIVMPVVLVLLTFLDVLERRRLEELREKARVEAERLAQARSDFLANMSHEIRTPMNAIIGMTELCLGTDPNPKQKNYLTKIRRASDTLLRIVNDILDFSRIESGKLEIERIPFDLERILDDIGALLADKAAEKSMELVFDVNSSDCHAFIGDPLRLEQVLINLIGNAIKFSDRGSVLVRACTRPTGPETADLCFEVIDQGIGLSPEEQARLFNAFTQADSTTTRRYGGTGLGLTICKRLVELMGGSIGIDSRKEEGSTFRFHVRVGIDTSAPSRISVMKRLLQPCNDRPVMVIDDNPVSRSAITALLGLIGLYSDPVPSGEEALEMLRNRNTAGYLAILVDRHMPGWNGIETLRRLRGHLGDAPQPPMILMYSHSPDRDKETFSGLSDGLLSKPVSINRLFAELSHVLGIEDAPQREKQSQAGNTDFEGVDILLIDDGLLNQEIVCNMLADTGATVRLANNGLEGIAEVMSTMPDCIMMDCQMPVMDGYTATRQLRQDPRYRNLPIIALTANAMPSERERCLEAGMDDYLAKPFGSEELYSVIARHVKPRAGGKAAAATSPAADGRTGDVLPPLPGIDIEAGLRYANGKPALYRKLLIIFNETHGHRFENGFREAIGSNNWHEAARLVHTLKSSARMIGAAHLGEAAETLETACHAKNGDEAMHLLSILLPELNEKSALLSSLSRES